MAENRGNPAPFEVGDLVIVTPQNGSKINGTIKRKINDGELYAVETRPFDGTPLTMYLSDSFMEYGQVERPQEAEMDVPIVNDAEDLFGIFEDDDYGLFLEEVPEEQRIAEWRESLQVRYFRSYNELQPYKILVDDPAVAYVIGTYQIEEFDAGMPYSVELLNREDESETNIPQYTLEDLHRMLGHKFKLKEE